MTLIVDEIKSEGGFTATTISVSGGFTSSDVIYGSKFNVTQSVGDEGGEIFLNKATTNTTLVGGVVIDVYQNKLRFFEQSGTTRGFYLDITTGSAGANTNLSTSNINGKIIGLTQIMYNF
jgi:hypothetical protein